MKFIQSFDEFSLYRLSDGTLDAIEHGGMARWRSDWDQPTFDALWCHWQDAGLDLEAFQAFARTVTEDRHLEVGVCFECDEMETDLASVQNGEQVCEHCIDSGYTFCDRCEEYHGGYDHDVSGESWCDSCTEHYSRWCERCEVRYSHNDSDDHDHDDGCDCESPAQQFTIRNNGDPVLGNDQRVTVSLPAGTISEEGKDEIYRYLRYAGFDSAFEAAQVSLSLDPRWQTKDGNYTKRLSRAHYKATGHSLPPEVISQVGNLARAHSESVNHAIEVTRDLNLSAEEFGYGGSCWWQSYYEGRCALKSNGGFGLRAFDEDGDVAGRAWVMPLHMVDGSLTPTFDALTPDAFIVFNGYGTLSGYTPARIMSYMAGMTYRKVGLSLSPMYINGDSGYLIAPESIADTFTDGNYYKSLNAHTNLFHTESRNERDNADKEMAHAC